MTIKGKVKKLKQPKDFAGKTHRATTRTIPIRGMSSTTKNRLNNLGANIQQKDFTWYTTKNGRIVEWTGTKRIRV